MKKIILLLIISTLFISIAGAVSRDRELIEIGTGTETGIFLPLDPGSQYSYTQSLFLQSEIEVADQQISKIYYQFNGNATFTDEISVYMGHTIQDSLSEWLPYSSLTQVYSGSITTTEVDSSWVEIELTIPFVYNNSDNLVIAVDENTTGTHYGSSFYGTQNSNPMSIYFKNWSNNPDPADPPEVTNSYGGAYTSTYRPNLRLQFDTPSSDPVAIVTPDNGYYGFIATGTTSNPYGDSFQLINVGLGTLTITSITDLSSTDFTTTFDDSTELLYGESHAFGFTYVPLEAGYDSTYVEIVTNAGTYGISLTAEAYQLNEGVIEIGIGEEIETKLPFAPNAKYNYTQSLFRQNEIAMGNEQITKLYYHYNGFETFTKDLVIYMGHTSQESLEDWIPLVEMTQVFSDQVTTLAEDSWLEINLEVPFAYNNIDNLVIAVDDNTNLTSNYNDHFYGTDTAENLSLHYDNYSVNPDPLNPPEVTNSYGGAYQSTYRPNVRLQFVEPPADPLAILNPQAADYGFIATETISDPYGELFQLINGGLGTLTVTSVTDLSSTDFSTTFNETVDLEFGELQSFGFTYAPTVGEQDSVYFEIVTNAGTVGIALTGEAYQLPDAMIEIGINESVGTYLPYDSGSKYSYTQSLFLQSEIEMADQQIDKIYYHFNGNTAYTDDIVIYMGHTTENTLSDWLPYSDLSQVYTGQIVTLAEDSWVEIDLQVPFAYNNIDNLVIAFDENTNSSNYNCNYFSTQTNENRSIYYKNYSNNPDPLDPPVVNNSYSGAYNSTFIPNIRLQFQELATEPEAVLNPDNGYYGFIATDTTSNLGEVFELINAGVGSLTISSTTDLSATDFTTTLDETAIFLAAGEAYSFGFTYAPTVAEQDSVYFEIVTNGGTVGISLTGESYELPDGMIEIGIENNVDTNLPFAPNESYSYTQSLFLQNEINQVDQQIDKILYHFNGNSAFTDDITIYMGHTTQDTLNNWLVSDELTLVYDGQLTTTEEEGWVEIILDFPFIYNNSDNLVIACDENTEGSNNYYDDFYASQTNTEMSIYYTDYSADIDPANLPEITNTWGGAWQSTYRPNIRMQFVDAVSEFPPTDLAVTETGYASWNAAYGTTTEREFLFYNVYLDDVLIGTTTDLFWQFTSLFSGQSYTAIVASQYEAGESVQVEYPFTCALAPVDNFYVNESGYSTWRAPGTGDQTELFFFDDFESGSDNWNVEINIGEGDWIVYSTPYPNGYTMPSNSSGNVMACDADETGNGTTTDASLILAEALDLRNVNNVILEFDSDFNAMNVDDYCYVDLSIDGGFTWVNILTYAGEDVRATHEVIDISDIAADEANVLIKFHSVQPGWDWWWTLDNISINSGTTAERELAGYNIYLDDTFVEYTTDRFYQYSGLVYGEEHVYGISAAYNEGESAIITQVAMYDPTFETPENLAVAVTDNDVALSWTAPMLAVRSEKKLELSAKKVDSEKFTSNLTTNTYRVFQKESGAIVVNSRNITITGYKVFKDGTMIHEITEAAVTNWDDQDLANGTYSYAVAAVYQEGESIPSETVEAVVEVPYIPNNLQATIQDINSVLLEWEVPVSTISAVEVKHNRRSSFTAKPNFTSKKTDTAIRAFLGYNIYQNGELIAELITETSYEITQFDAGVYLFSVTAMYNAGESEAASAEVVIVLPAPLNVTAVDEGVNIQISWDAPTDASTLESYIIYVDGENVGSSTTTTFVWENIADGSYEISVTAIYVSGFESEISEIFTFAHVDTNEIELPLVTSLAANYPNPFNPSVAGRCPTTTIKFCIKEDNNVKIEIFNARGQKVKTLLNENLSAGYHTAIWNGNDNNNHIVSSGIFFYRMQTENYSSIQKMLLLK